MYRQQQSLGEMRGITQIRCIVPRAVDVLVDGEVAGLKLAPVRTSLRDRAQVLYGHPCLIAMSILESVLAEVD